MNLIDDAKRLEAVSLVKKGRTVSLSRPFPVEPSAENPRPAVQFLMKGDRPPGGGAATGGAAGATGSGARGSAVSCDARLIG